MKRAAAHVALLLAGCGQLRSGPSDTSDAGDDGGVVVLPDGAVARQDSGVGGNPDGGGADGGGAETLGQAAVRLAALRFPGPLTSQGSLVVCTPSGVTWKDGDGTLHSWRYDTQKQLDYSFKAQGAPRLPIASDVVVAVNAPGYTNLLAYDATQGNALLATLPYAFNFYADDTGVVRLDRSVNGTPLTGTKVRKWTASTSTTTDVSTVLSTQQPPSAFANGRVVLPVSVNAPFVVYVVDVAAMTTAKVTFDGGIATYDYLPLPSGLLLSYARTGPTPSIRLYRQYDDGNRVELGDEVRNIPPLFAGSPPNEHTFIARIAASGSVLIYGSAFGIWGYDMVKGTLFPVQLGDGKTTYVADAMCTMDTVAALAYRVQGDATGQVWMLPLAKVLP